MSLAFDTKDLNKSEKQRSLLFSLFPFFLFLSKVTMVGESESAMNIQKLSTVTDKQLQRNSNSGEYRPGSTRLQKYQDRPNLTID